MMQGRSIAGRNDASAAWMAAGEALRSFVQFLSTETTTKQDQASSHHSPPLCLTAAAPEEGSCAEDSPRDTALELE